MTPSDRPRRSRSRSPARCLVSKISKSGSQSQPKRRTRKSWTSNIPKIPSIMSSPQGQRISVHVGELLHAPPSPRYHPYTQAVGSKSTLGLSIVSENGLQTPSDSKSRLVRPERSRSRSASNSSSVGPYSIDCGIIHAQPADISPRCPPMSPLDHFEKWFPESPTEAPKPLFHEKQRKHVSKALPPPPFHIFDPSKKRQLVLLVTLVAILSPLSMSIYFPTIRAISEDFEVSTTLVLLTISVYIFIQGVAPFFWLPLCDAFGRRPMFIITLLIFLGADIGLLMSNSILTLTMLRGLQSFGTAALTATCQAVIGDISTPQERKKYIGFFGATLTFTFVSPTIGGILTFFMGWRSIFWFLGAFSLIALILIILFLPETIRSIAGNGSYRLGYIHQPVVNMIKSSHDAVLEPDSDDCFKVSLTFLSLRSFVEPLYCLKQKNVLLSTIFGAVTFAIFTTTIATTTMMFKEHYNYLSALYIGLAFLPAGAGSVFTFFTIGYLMDHDLRITETHYRRMHGLDASDLLNFKTLEDFPLERARLRNLWWITLVFIGTVAGYGFSFQQRSSSIAGPLIIQFLIGASATAMLLLNSVLIGDLSKQHMSVSPAMNLIRFLLTALAIGTVQPSLDRIGSGFTFLAMALIMLSATPIMIGLWFFGKPWVARRNSTWPKPRLVRFSGWQGGNAFTEKVKELKWPRVFRR